LISAITGQGIEELKNTLLTLSSAGALGKNDTIITNNRHYDALLKALESIQRVKEGMDIELSSDLMAIDIREALYHLGVITGSVSTDDLLGNIFSNFCIGK
jgi:tRNA modification GTPase